MKLGDLKVTAISIVAALFLSISLPSKTQTSGDEFPSLLVSREKDFIVKFKGDIFSWKNLSYLLRQHNITVPDERAVFAAVLEQKESTVHSCTGRCFSDERKYHETCFCDTACTTFRDCCLDFHSRCGQTGNDASLQKVACGNVNEYSWSGEIMKSFCSLQGHQSTKNCQNVQRLNMTLQKELPVFDLAQNITYRSIACARCNNKANLSFWGLNVTCVTSSGPIGTPVNITAVKIFLKDHSDCSWRYAPRTDLNERYESCVLPDTQCVTSNLPVLSIVKELCSLYSMVFSVGQRHKVSYRNPHCALCNTKGRPLPQEKDPYRPSGPSVPPLSILLDVKANIPDKEEPNNPPPTLITESLVLGYNLTKQVANCASNTTNCTVSFGGYRCENVTFENNQSTQMRFYLNESHIGKKQLLREKNPETLHGKTFYIVCPEKQAGQGGPSGQVDKNASWDNTTILSYITLTGTLLSIVSLCFLLSIYFSFKELRNLPGKCLINLSLALLCFQVIFLGVEKSKNVDPLCKAVAIFLHFYILAAFSWMTVMAYDTASTFKVQVSDVRRQPSDTTKTFIKYCIVGWGLPAVFVVLCFVLDFTRTFHFGYGISTYCWISDKIAITVAMVSPVSLALVFNATCLTKSIYAIRHLQQGASQATNNGSRASLTLICIKLTTVMGLIWILGLIANWKETAFLKYPSTVLNSMQGLFITLFFITTKKVRGLLRNSFFKRWSGTVEPQASFSRCRRTGITDLETTAGFNAVTVAKRKCDT